MESLLFLMVFFWPHFKACGILVPFPGLDPHAPSIGNTVLTTNEGSRPLLSKLLFSSCHCSHRRFCEVHMELLKNLRIPCVRWSGVWKSYDSFGKLTLGGVWGTISGPEGCQLTISYGCFFLKPEYIPFSLHYCLKFHQSIWVTHINTLGKCMEC